MKSACSDCSLTPTCHRVRGHAATLVGLFLLGCCGCRPTVSEAPSATTEAPGRAATGAVREVWEVLQIDGVRVGYGRRTVRRETGRGREVLRNEALSQMKFRRAGQEVQLRVEFGSIETPDGELLEFESGIWQDSTPMQQSSGRIAGDELLIEVTTQGKMLTTSIPWPADGRGPFAAEQTLRQEPMEPGQRRMIRELVPGINLVGTTELVARHYEPVEVLGRTHRLLRIDTTTTFPDNQRLRGTIWTDRSGEILRSHEEAMSLDSCRATKAVALAESDEAVFDLVSGLLVKLDRRLERPHQTRRIRYVVHLEGDDPAQVFASGGSQRVRSIDPHTAEVTVWAVRPDRPGNPDAVEEPPTEDDLEPNNLVQSDNPKIVALARQAAGDRKGPWSVAVALERCVREHVRLSDYSQAFATAAEVVESGRGDCTEHAVLLAALARARGIPARMAIGLVYLEQEGDPAMGYHMWNEVYVGGRWIGLDATLGRGGIGAAHLKLTETSLAGASALGSFLPVAQVADRLRIEIEEVE